MAAFIARTEGAYVSHHYVAKLWRDDGIRPHRQGTFKVSKDPAFAGKVADIVGLSDDSFFPTLRELERRQRELRNEESRFAATVLRARADMSDIRDRWYSGDLDLSQKRALIKEALHAVIVHPVGPGGRGTGAVQS